jgi:hypothetical protein
MRISQERRRIHHERIPIGRTLRHERGANRSAGADPVVDYELLVELLAHFLKCEAADDIGCTAGRKHNDDPRRL